MRVLLFIRDTDDRFIHMATATTKKEIYALMEYATFKVSNGYDVKIEHEQVQE